MEIVGAPGPEVFSQLTVPELITKVTPVYVSCGNVNHIYQALQAVVACKVYGGCAFYQRGRAAAAIGQLDVLKCDLHGDYERPRARPCQLRTPDPRRWIAFRLRLSSSNCCSP